MQQIEKISALLVNYIRNELSADEADYLKAWLNESEKNQQFFEEICIERDLISDIRAVGETRHIELNDAWEKMQVVGWEPPKPTGVLFNWEENLMTVAVLIGIVCTCVFWRGASTNNQIPLAFERLNEDVRPVLQKAYLILEDGEILVLDTAQNGLLTTQGNTRITKSADGGLRYTTIGDESRRVIYNKLTVPYRGKVGYLKLSDGSKVWLNEESAIWYPVDFNDKERKVEFTGEGYFEINRYINGLGPNCPFIVKKGSVRVITQGAKFNVNMSDIPGIIKVTVLTGSVDVEVNDVRMSLYAGQQAVLGSKKIKVKNLNDR